MVGEWYRPQGEVKANSLLFDRRDVDGRMPFNQQPDQETGLFPLELEQCDKLYQSCHEYMGEADLALVCRAMVFTLQAHAQQYRYSGEPYSIHPLVTALDLVTQKLDAITISGALLHDVMEDTSIEYAQIDKAVCAGNQKVSLELENTLEGVSNLRSRHMRKGLRDEEYEQQIIRSIINNPRVALIKIADRKHNLRTLYAVPSPYKRAQTCRETQLVYIPLARVLGLTTEVDELGELTLENQSDRHHRILKRINIEIDSLKELSPARALLTELREDIAERVSNYNCYGVSTRYPSAYAVFEEMGGRLREPTQKDCVIKASIALRGLSRNALDWAQRAVGIKTVFTYASEYELVEGLTDDKQFRDDCENGRVNSLTFRVKRKSDNLYIDISVYPADAYEQQITPITYLYHLRRVTEPAMNIPLSSPSTEGVSRQHELANRKLQGIVVRYQKLQVTHPGEVRAAQMVLFLGETIPKDKIIVTGIDDNGFEEAWITETGSTIMDYAREVRHNTWFRAAAVWVNGVQADFSYQLQPGDKVHIDFGDKPNWDPWWMYCFGNDDRGKYIVKRHVKELLESYDTEESQAMKSRLYETGIRIIERNLSADNQPLRVGIDAALNLIREHYPQISAKDFLIKVALDEVNPLLLREVVKTIGEYNRQVFVVRLEFGENRTGQTQRVMAVVNRMGLGYASFQGRSLTETEGPVQMLLYFSPEDRGQREAIINALQQDPICQELSLVSVG